MDREGRGTSIAAWWRELPHWSRALTYLAGAVVVLGLGGEPALRAANPDAAVELALTLGSRVDPWGQRWVRDLYASVGGWEGHSIGPNGIDESGAGDDVLVGTCGLNPLADIRSGLGLQGLLPGAGDVFFAAACVLLWFGLGASEWATPRSERLGVEVARVLAVASLPALVAGVVTRAAAEALLPAGAATPLLVVSPPLAAGGTAGVLCVLVAAALRWRAPSAEFESPVAAGTVRPCQPLHGRPLP